MCLGAVAAMCGFGVFVTSFARNEREAFAASLIVGLVLALLGGNLLPPGALPRFLQVLSLATPNGWALVGFGRLSLLHDPASRRGRAVSGALPHRRRDHRVPRHDPGPAHGGAVIPVVRVNVRRAVGDARLVFVATVFPVLVHPRHRAAAGQPQASRSAWSTRRRAFSNWSNEPVGSRLTLEASRASLDDDILRGRVVAGLVTLPARRRCICMWTW